MSESSPPSASHKLFSFVLIFGTGTGKVSYILLSSFHFCWERRSLIGCLHSLVRLIPFKLQEIRLIISLTCVVYHRSEARSLERRSSFRILLIRLQTSSNHFPAFSSIKQLMQTLRKLRLLSRRSRRMSRSSPSGQQCHHHRAIAMCLFCMTRRCVLKWSEDPLTAN
ncbi:hypothetical protein SISSUDRAFT_664685 [Sistotremastrum suecicum HHB10207 ss-3]|uniref:Uncharacterized protein n=1 Tax=Sistotremastrum suecicum HHB10207 ss-3 TaxID=1314776 RepID=A0A165X2F3_9AGAM|nr:hypothetical protein SISSUDRAFT_664685 [Sistotremastrum suecicum HHB10207 ss-3]